MKPPLSPKLTDPEDRSFLDKLYTDYNRLMLSEISKMIGDDPACEDLVQDCLVSLTKHLPLLRELDRDKRVNYIITTARNCAKNYLRSMNRAAVSSLEEIDCEPSPVSGPEQDVFKKLDRHEFHSAWHKLDSTSKTLLQGKYLEGHSDEELAQMLGCKDSSIRMLLSRARSKARNLFTF